MIQVTNAVKRFDGFTALDGASITVPDAPSTDWWVPTAQASPP